MRIRVEIDTDAGTVAAFDEDGFEMPYTRVVADLQRTRPGTGDPPPTIHTHRVRFEADSLGTRATIAREP